jgi:hypothetical protein
MWVRRFRVVLVLILASLAFGLAASASIVREMSVEQMAQMATEVVEGRVELLRAVSEEGRIDTIASVRVGSALKGDVAAGALLDVRLPGGRVGELAQTVAGAPVFEAGLEVVVFLWTDPETRQRRVLGLSQGAFRVETREQRREVVSDRRGLLLAHRPGTTSAGEASAPPEHGERSEHTHGGELRLPLDELRSRVAQALREVKP